MEMEILDCDSNIIDNILHLGTDNNIHKENNIRYLPNGSPTNYININNM